jgi:spermidine synthase
MFAALTALFFLSGTSALIYQVLWLRKLSLIFGVTVYAASTVLASFMAGLSTGSAVAGRVADRVHRPLVWFGATEILIGLTALASPFALDLVTAAYIRAAADVDSRAALTLVRLVCSAAVLLPPAILMGATLPLVLRSAFVDAAGIGSRVGVLYGVNTAGAIAGALLAGFVLIGAIGLNATFRIAAAINLAVGIGAILLARSSNVVASGSSDPGDAARSPDRALQDRTSGSLRIVLLAFALSGFTALALEVVWFRTLVLYYPATTYAFTAMLATVLTGIAAGSLLIAPVLRRRAPALWWFGGLHATAGVAAIAGARWLAALYDPASAAGGLVRGASITILPAALAMGMAFPVGVRLWLESADHAGRRVGMVYAINLAGAIAGSLAAGFVLLPSLGSAKSLAMLGVVSVATGVLVLLGDARRAPRVVWPVIALSIALVATLAPRTPDPFRTGLIRRYRDAGMVFMRDEGIQTTVSVHMRELGWRQLYLDGLHQASDGRDVVLLHRQIGHVPVLLHPNPHRALVIGLGGGATAGAVSLHPDLRVDVVELAPGVVKAADWFTHINEDVLRRPNVTLHVDDARNYLLMGRGTYDVITADIIQPTHAGAGLLYSREYFELARQALTDGGVMVQWVGQRSDLHYKLIARTFQSVFPDTTVWVNGSLLIGSTRRLALDRAALARRFAAPALRASLAAAGIPEAETLLNYYTAGAEDLRRFLGEGPVLTDDRPMLEYYLSLPDDRRPVDLRGLSQQRLSQ